MKGVLNKIGLLCVGVLLGLIVFEIGLRMFDLPKVDLHWAVAFTDKSFFKPDGQRLYAIRGGVDWGQDWRSDDEGFRFNEGHSVNSKDEGRKVVVMVGDSFTYGYLTANDQTFPKWTEEGLLLEGQEVVVHNAGVPGYGFDQEFLYIEEMLDEVESDVLVWNLNATSDFADANKACLFRRDKGDQWREIVTPWQNTLYWEGKVVAVVPRWMKDLRLVKMIATLPKSIAGEERYTFGCSMKDLKYTKRINLMAEKAEYFLREIKKKTERKGITFLVTIVPYQDYFYGEKGYEYVVLRDLVRRVDVDFVDFNYQLANRHDVQLLANEVEFGDDSQVLGMSSSINLKDDIFLTKQEDPKSEGRHLNETGNRMLGKMMADYLLSKNLL